MASDIFCILLGIVLILMGLMTGNLWELMAGFAVPSGRAIYLYWRFLYG